MRVLITGAGLIGTHTAKELIDRGDEVTFFDFAPRPDYIRQVTGKDLPVLRGDIRDLAALVDAFQTVRPECVIHLAASVGEANINNVYTGFQINLVAAINVAEAVRLAGVRRLVHASTQAVYAGEDPKELLREDSPIDCRERVYNASKIGCEHVLRTYSAKHKIELALLRFAGVYGYYFRCRRPGRGGAAGGVGRHGRQAGDAQCVRDRRFHLCQGPGKRHCFGRAYFAAAA